MGHTRTTESGIRFKTTTEFESWWSEYDYAVADTHMKNYGVIILDEYDCPIDNEYDLEEVEEYL